MSATKIDSAELERKARAITDRAHSTVADGPVMLALIARIRELEVALAAAADREAVLWSGSATAIRALVARGTVLR
jgi:hypothetical protein